MTLPDLKFKASPNFSIRMPPKIDLIVLHDTEGSYSSAINTFMEKSSQVSAHIVLREDGLEATQMVKWQNKAWHVRAFNSRSIGIEMAGFASKGYLPAQWQAAANIMAWLCIKFNIPADWSMGGAHPGVCRHYDLGLAGGGHSDPTTDNARWQAFLVQFKNIFKAGGLNQNWDMHSTL